MRHPSANAVERANRRSGGLAWHAARSPSRRHHEEDVEGASRRRGRRLRLSARWRFRVPFAAVLPARAGEQFPALTAPLL